MKSGAADVGYTQPKSQTSLVARPHINNGKLHPKCTINPSDSVIALACVVGSGYMIFISKQVEDEKKRGGRTWFSNGWSHDCNRII